MVTNNSKNSQYLLDDTKFTQRVYKGDQFLVPTEKGQIVLTVRDTLSSFGLDTPAGVFYTDLAEESEIDISKTKFKFTILIATTLYFTKGTKFSD